MDSLYSRSEETFTRCLLSSVPLDRLLLALSVVTHAVLAAPSIPAALRPRLLRCALRMLRDIELRRDFLDPCFTMQVPHPRCTQRWPMLGELWELPPERDWLCDECGKPLYSFTEH